MKSLVVALSGGLDSVIAYWYAKKNFDGKITPVYISMGVPYEWKEKQALKELGIDYKEIKVGIIDKDNTPTAKDIFIPGRNLVIASVLSTLSPDEIWLSAVKGEGHRYATDKNNVFFEFTNILLEYIHSKFGHKIRLKTPFKDMSKLDIVGWALDNGYTKEDILKTSSCLEGDKKSGKNCGNCMVCMRRKGIFKYYGFEEEYNQDPFKSLLGKQALDKLIKADKEKDYSHYDMSRINEVKLGFPELFNKNN